MCTILQFRPNFYVTPKRQKLNTIINLKNCKNNDTSYECVLGAAFCDCSGNDYYNIVAALVNIYCPNCYRVEKQNALYIFRWSVKQRIHHQRAMFFNTQTYWWW
jgi:hypothetical protein